MENQFSIKVVSEFDLLIATRILLLFNKKKVKVSSIHVIPNHESNEFHHSYIIEGSIKRVVNVSRIVAKQIGVHKVFRYQINEVINYESLIQEYPNNFKRL